MNALQSNERPLATPRRRGYVRVEKLFKGFAKIRFVIFDSRQFKINRIDEVTEYTRSYGSMESVGAGRTIKGKIKRAKYRRLLSGCVGGALLEII